jgi:hypothetical protein
MLYLSTHCNAPPPYHHRALGAGSDAGVAGSVPPIYTKCATSAYPRGGVLVRAYGPWDTFPTERRRRGGDRKCASDAGSVAGSVPPIYTKGDTYAYLYGGGLVRAHGPWDTFPTERRRRRGGDRKCASDAGSVSPIYTKGATYTYTRGGGLVRAHGPWDTFPTERRRGGDRKCAIL